MDHMIRTFRELFLAIWSEQDEAWRKDRGPNKPSVNATDVLNRVRTQGSFANQLDRDALLNRLPSKTQLELDFKRAYLLLPPSPKAADFVPLMWMSYNLTVKPVEVRICITMFCHHGADLKSFPFRLENGSGRHAFYHAQLGNNMDVRLEPEWLPESQPSFPLCANCPVTLVISLLLTLYGLNETGRLLTHHDPYRIGRYKGQLEPWVKV